MKRGTIDTGIKVFVEVNFSKDDSMGIEKSYKVLGLEKDNDSIEGIMRLLHKVKKYGAAINGQVFKLTVFTSCEDEDSYRSKAADFSRAIFEYFRDEVPAFNIVSQKPFPDSLFAVEAGFVTGQNLQIHYKMHRDTPYILIEDAMVKELWMSGAGEPDHFRDIEQDAICAFEQVVEILGKEGMTMDHIIRQWNYVGEILKMNDADGRCLQNYQVFNEVRGQFYKQYRTRKDFPAATGIGVKIPGVTIDFCAIKSLVNRVASVPVNNPNQQNAYVYGQEVLVGSASATNAVKQPPQFERGRLLKMPGYSTLFLSGTASIIGQETIGIGDVEQQTRVTIDNLERLSKSPEGFSNRETWSYNLLRVYVKNEKDFPVVQQICTQYFPNVPMVFVQADVCRDNLLVEIEGEMVASN